MSGKQFEINQSIIFSLSEIKIQEKLSNQNFSLVFPLLKLTLRTHKQKKKVYKDIKLDYQITGKKSENKVITHLLLASSSKCLANPQWRRKLNRTKPANLSAKNDCQSTGGFHQQNESGKWRKQVK